MEHALGIDSGTLGESIPQRELRRQIARVAGTDATVLLVGETGTGKELVAHAIHRNSRRAHGPFVAINCASFVDTLLESELFGHERGAFTGALARKRGRLELADGGTLFLDEIGELALPLQAKLLRVIETRTMDRLGHQSRSGGRGSAGRVSPRSLFRLRVVTLRTPALRDCPNDISCSRSTSRRISPGGPDANSSASTPECAPACRPIHGRGNVRELKHAMESAVVLGSGEMLFAEDLPEQIRVNAPAGGLDGGTYTPAIETARRDVIVKAFAQADYAHDTAAGIPGLHPTYLYKLMRRMDLTVRKG